MLQLPQQYLRLCLNRATSQSLPYAAAVAHRWKRIDYTQACRLSTMTEKGANGFSAYIISCRERLEKWRSSKSTDKVRVVLGNEAMDLDSMAASMVWAYWLTHVGVADRLVIPVMNVPRAEMKLRKDNLVALAKAGLGDDAGLIYEDEIDLRELNEKKMLELVLVDHNAISPRRKYLSNSVVQIIDHHTDAGKHMSAERHLRVPIGSCCSLITEHIHGSESAGLLESKPLNLLLRMSIIIDTLNLKHKVKTTPLDTAMLQLLKESGKVDVDSAELCEELQAARVDMEGFTAVEVIKKDLKYEEDQNERYLFAISSVKTRLEGVGVNSANLSSFLGELASFMDDKSAPLDASFVLCLEDEKAKRLVAAIRDGDKASSAANVVSKIVAALKEKREYQGIAVTGSLDKDWPTSTEKRTDMQFACFYIQQPCGRKQVLPFLRDVFSSL